MGYKGEGTPQVSLELALGPKTARGSSVAAVLTCMELSRTSMESHYCHFGTPLKSLIFSSLVV